MKKILLVFIGLIALTACASSTSEGLKFVAEENSSTGYSWVYEMDNKILEEGKGDYTSSCADNVVGCGGKRTLEFTPIESGTTRVTFTYKRSWESSDPEYWIVYDVTVDENMNVEISEVGQNLEGMEAELMINQA